MYGKDENGATAQYLVEHTGTMSGKRHEFRVNLGGSEDNHITIKIYEEFVAVYITESVQEQQSFSDSVGLMGQFTTGKMMARDGQTILDDPIKFGNEWQVQNNETLFQSLGSPQWPEPCVLPSKEMEAQRRRLGEGREGLLYQLDQDRRICRHGERSPLPHDGGDVEVRRTEELGGE